MRAIATVSVGKSSVEIPRILLHRLSGFMTRTIPVGAPRLAPRKQNEQMNVDTPKYRPSDEVDFVIVGSGAAGGILAKELSTNGFRVVVLEQWPYLTEKDFTHNEVKVLAERS